MRDKLLNHFIYKKQKKEKILMFSFINNYGIELYNDANIDILRFDNREFCYLYNFKDITRLENNDVLPLIKNVETKGTNNKKLLAIDIPAGEIFYNSSYSLDKILTFYKKTNADLLILDYNFVIGDVINKLSKMQIPVIVTCDNPDLAENEKLFNNLLEVESMGAVMLILEGFEAAFIQKIKNSLIIPVISDEIFIKSDGYYAQFSSVFGLLESDKKKYLNLKELIKDGINDYTGSLKK